MFHITRGDWHQNVLCVNCKEESPERSCNQCDKLFCASCFDDIHRNSATMRNHTFQNIPRSMVEKVSAQFEWPRDRPLDPTMDSNTAFVNAQSLMKAGMQRQDP